MNTVVVRYHPFKKQFYLHGMNRLFAKQAVYAALDRKGWKVQGGLVVNSLEFERLPKIK